MKYAASPYGVAFAIRIASSSVSKRAIAGDGAERLLARHPHLGRHAGEDRRAEELALEALAARDELGTMLERVGDVALDLLERRLVDQRPDLDAVREPVGDHELRDRRR